jgi:LmbE family N-acetylglucosaminyl deacetylase
MRVVAIGAHPDDVELGCGGTLLAHRAAGDDVTVLVMTDGTIGPQGAASRRDEQRDAAALLGARLVWGGFEDGAVPDGVEAVSAIQAVVADADVVYTHSVHDTHQDHRATARASFAAARRVARVLSYESPSSVDFEPTLFFDISGHVDGKLDLIRAHLSQVLGCGLVDLEAVAAQARFRGFQARATQAEAFEVHRFLWRRQPLEPAPGHADGEKTALGSPTLLGSHPTASTT